MKSIELYKQKLEKLELAARKRNKEIDGAVVFLCNVVDGLTEAANFEGKSVKSLYNEAAKRVEKAILVLRGEFGKRKNADEVDA